MEGEDNSGPSGPLSISAGDVIVPSTGTGPTSMPTGSSSRSSSRRSRSRDGSRRHRSSSNRSRSRHSRSGRSRSRLRFKRKERNFPAAVCSMVTIVIICTAIAEPRWISLHGGECHLKSNNGKLTFLGVFQFLYAGSFTENPADHSATVYNYGPSSSEQMVNCVTRHAVFLFKSMLAFCFLAVVCSLCAFLLDLTGPSNRCFRILRRNAIFSITTVILCVVINLLCYWITTVVGDLQKAVLGHAVREVEVTFDVSFYLLTAAGGIAVLGTACNCLKRYPPSRPDSTPYLLLDDYDELEAMLGPSTFSGTGSSFEGSSPPENLPPPPPYTP